ncbi:hypothetical protein HDV00_004896 [Rhizophlyctis rosea]|nr:hypothetical protein HDV00_004896 [Rhizophlyctis rosea]
MRAIFHRSTVRITNGTTGPIQVNSGSLFSYTVPHSYQNLTDVRGSSVDGTVALPPWMWFNNRTMIFAGKCRWVEPLEAAQTDRLCFTGSPYTNLPIPETSVRIFFTGFDNTSLVTVPFTVVLDGNHPPLPQPPLVPLDRTSGITYQQLTNNTPPVAFINSSYNFVFPRGLIIDEDGDVLTYRAEALHQDQAPAPVWLRFDNTTLQFTGVPSNITPLDIVLSATDPKGAVARVTFHIDVQNNTQDTGTASPAFTPPADMAEDQYAVTVIKIVVPSLIVLAVLAGMVVWGCARRTSPRFSKYSDLESVRTRSVRSQSGRPWSFSSEDLDRKGSVKTLMDEPLPPVPPRRVLTVRNDDNVTPSQPPLGVLSSVKPTTNADMQHQPTKRPASLGTMASNQDTVRDLYALYLNRIGKRASERAALLRVPSIARVPSRSVVRKGRRRTASDDLRVGRKPLLGLVGERIVEDDEETIVPSRSGGSSRSRRVGRSLSCGGVVGGEEEEVGEGDGDEVGVVRRRRTGSVGSDVGSLGPVVITPPPEIVGGVCGDGVVRDETQEDAADGDASRGSSEGEEIHLKVGDIFQYKLPIDDEDEEEEDVPLAVGGGEGMRQYRAMREDGTGLPSWLRFSPSSRTLWGCPYVTDFGEVDVMVVEEGKGCVWRGVVVVGE